MRVWAEQVSVRVVREAACSVVSVVGEKWRIHNFTWGDSNFKWGDKRPHSKMNKMEVEINPYVLF
jgi:hypothetical protein